MTILNIQDLDTFEELSTVNSQAINGQESTIITTGNGTGFTFGFATGSPPSFSFSGPSFFNFIPLLGLFS